MRGAFCAAIVAACAAASFNAASEKNQLAMCIDAIDFSASGADAQVQNCAVKSVATLRKFNNMRSKLM